MSDFAPDYELQRRVIEILSADATLQELLFPEWQLPKQNVSDTRIYGAHVDLRNPAFIALMPRVIIETQMLSNDWEQTDSANSGPVALYVHSFSQKDQYHTAVAIDQRIRTIIASTYLTNSRIIASELVQDGPRRRYVETLFDDAWRLSSGYRVQNVGVLV